MAAHKVGVTIFNWPRPATRLIATQKKEPDISITHQMVMAASKEEVNFQHSAIRMSIILEDGSGSAISLGVYGRPYNLSRSALFTLSDFSRNMTANRLNPKGGNS